MAARNSNGKPAPEKAVLYLRMSSAKQDKSIGDQRVELTTLAQRKGYSVLREYVDEAISGDDTERRPEFLRLRQDCENGPDFGTILVWDQDRLSRNDPLEIGYWLKPIRDAGVVVETPQGRVDWDTLGGRLIYLISQEMKHDYLRSLSRNVSRGLLAEARRDKHRGTGGKDPFGYWTDETGTVVVNSDEAAVVRKIFEWYVKPGSSLRSIASRLNAAGIKTRRGTPWKQTSVRRILRNPKYTGCYLRFRYLSGKYFGVSGGEIVTRNKADKTVEVEPLLVPGNHTPIIPQELFDQVQRKLDQAQKWTARRDAYQYVFRGLIFCGDCKRVMQGGSVRHDPQRHNYLCKTYHSGGKAACYCNTIDEDHLLACVRRKLDERYFGETAIERMRTTIKQAQAEAAEPVSPVDERHLRKRIEALDQQIDAGAERVFSAPEALVPKLYAKLEKLRQDRDQLQRQLDAVGRTEKRSAQERDQEVEAALDALRRLRETLDAAGPEDLREYLRKIVVRIELEFTHRQDGKLTRNSCTGGEILVRPDAGLGSLMFPHARCWPRGCGPAGPSHRVACGTQCPTSYSGMLPGPACERQSLARIRHPDAHTIGPACEHPPTGRDPARAGRCPRPQASGRPGGRRRCP
ncbi:MAG: recombinase family protein [Candidatus Anammoximicrobium sp.]|nr:recombinase family protein [Candidatus Anammoximicrobium sp.]